MRYYREPNGDYLAVDLSSRAYYVRYLGQNRVEGRAACIAGLASSVCTTGVSQEYLDDCTPIRRADVPREWQNYIAGAF